MKNQKNRINQMEVHYEAIKRLFPASAVTLEIHSIDMKNLPANWKAEKETGKLSGEFVSAHRNGNPFDITLFD